MIDVVILQGFAIALALGAFIGLEREYARYRKRGHDYAGIRTFPLISLFGALSAYLGNLVSIWILIVGIILIGILIIIAYFSITRRSIVHFGVTSELAGFLTFFIGMLSYYGELSLAAILTIAVTIILYARSILHQFARKIKEKELTDALKFAVIAFVVLPFLPNQGYGPLQIFNPFLIWLMVVLISGIGFTGYILMKWLGERGITIAGLLGGLVSSTATTLSFAERSKKQTRISKALVLGVILANGVMFVRVMLEVALINRELFLEILLPLLILGLVTIIFSVFLWKKIGQVKGKINLQSPLSLGPAVKFGLLFAVVISLAKMAEFYFSSQGVYIVSILSGIADVDAIALSLSQLAKSSLPLATARNGVLIAVITNVAVKGGMAFWFGGKEFGKMVLVLFSVLVVVGAGLIYFL